MNVPAQGLVCATLVIAGCDFERDKLDPSEARAVTLAVLSDFLRKNDSGSWPKVFISDEYIGFSIDTGFLQALPRSNRSYEVARRATVWVSTDIVRDGGLFLEAGPPEVTAEGSVTQALRFSSTQDFAGELLYRLQGAFDRWLIGEVRVIWIV